MRLNQQLAIADLHTIAFKVDHFGIITDALFSKLHARDSDKRKRLSALKSLEKLAIATGQLPKGARVLSIGLTTDDGGELYYEFAYAKHTANTRPAVLGDVIQDGEELRSYLANGN